MMMMMINLIGRPIGKLVHRILLALVPPPGRAHRDAPPVYPRFPPL
jgi:hypothetical protein